MDYKILYIEDLEPDTRIETLKKDFFKIEPLKPTVSIDNIISQIKAYDPHLIIMDYILTEGTDLKFCNAPTIASTLRSLNATGDQIEKPIVLMSTKENIVDSYKKDYTSHDLFDYAVTKDSATKQNTDKFIKRCISFIKAYDKIKSKNYNLSDILEIDEKALNHKIDIILSQKNKSIYEYSRFIHEHLIRCSGLLIGKDILAARLGISKESRDWENVLQSLSASKYNGIFSDSYDRWWTHEVENWWKEVIGANYSLRHYDAEERLKILKQKLNLNLTIAVRAKKNRSNNYWTICQKTKLPLDPSEGIELLDEEIMPWQEKNYLSVDGYLQDIEYYSQKVSELDRKEMRTFKQ